MNDSQPALPGIPFLSPFFLKPHLDCFTQELAGQGYSALTIRGYADSVAHFGSWLQSNNMSLWQVSERAVSSFGEHYCRCPGGRKSRKLSINYVKRVGRFVLYLSQQGAIDLRQLDQTEPIVPELISRFVEHLRLRGLSWLTIDQYQRAIAKLLPMLGDDPRVYDATCVRRAIGDSAKTHSLPETKKHISALRAFLRFLAVEDLCVPDLDCAVPKVAQWSLSSLPRYITAQQVESVIDSCPADTALGWRDRAIILLLSRLGLRAGDIVNMQLTDIDWQAATVRVSGKGRREDLLPLPQDVGDAVAKYIDHARPTVAKAQLFLCLNAPYRPFAGSPTVSGIVSAALSRAGISNPPSRGAHVLRHSAATNMLRSGMTLDSVSSMLRHRSLDMTAYYAKVDIHRLRQIAQSWPEDVSC
ncbi:MAG: site-specific integrase [Gammaproteobacteria bacterium]|nr:site-specific integrase [Gammaproteobacteria bacterium]MDP6652223.1 site-specific integrase [Gammaproteobacteria bacterium]